MIAVVLLFALSAIQNGLHYVDGVLDELGVYVRHDDLNLNIEKLGGHFVKGLQDNHASFNGKRDQMEGLYSSSSFSFYSQMTFVTDNIQLLQQ